jgi:hypothetical protein
MIILRFKIWEVVFHAEPKKSILRFFLLHVILTVLETVQVSQNSAFLAAGKSRILVDSMSQ